MSESVCYEVRIETPTYSLKNLRIIATATGLSLNEALDMAAKVRAAGYVPRIEKAAGKT